jgi:hypothetical protein
MRATHRRYVDQSSKLAYGSFQESRKLGGCPETGPE